MKPMHIPIKLGHSKVFFVYQSHQFPDWFLPDLMTVYQGIKSCSLEWYCSM
jgi:hypothetical protein